MVLMVHKSAGPFAGHDGNRPVSLETSVRSGPRHCGQSLAAKGVKEIRPTRKVRNARVFIRSPRLNGSDRGKVVQAGSRSTALVQYTGGRVARQAVWPVRLPGRSGGRGLGSGTVSTGAGRRHGGAHPPVSPCQLPPGPAFKTHLRLPM